jgi:glycosyltransferase involved in cell wall biosynthesis
MDSQTLAEVMGIEGYGVPMLEAQACGTPVITGRWTAQAEVVGSGVFIEKD